MSEYNICYSLDSKYAEQSAVSITSIIKNTDVNDIVNFYILDGGLTDKDKSDIELLKNIKNFNIKYITINPDDFSSCPMLKDKDNHYSDYHVTLPTYFRFKSASIFNKLNKILYLDCDVIVRKPLKELFDINMEKYAVSMVLDAEYKKEAKRLGLTKYYNAGVMLINLDYWRKNDVENRLFNYALNNKDNILWQDQDIINCVLADEINEIEEKWNYQYFLYEKIDINKFSDFVILHLSGRFKPWLIHFEHPVYDEYYYYLSFTPWHNKILEYKQLCSGKFLKDNVGGRSTNILLNVTDKFLYTEMEKNYKYTEKIVEDAINLFVQKIMNKSNEIYEYINVIDKELKIKYELADKNNKDLIEKDYNNKIKNEVNGLNYKIVNIENQTEMFKNEILNANRNQIKELYAYINEQYLKIINEMIGNNKNNEEQVNKKITSVNNYINFVENNIKNIEHNIENKAEKSEINNFNTELNKRINEIEKIYQNKINEIENSFENKLNNQRIQYEEKLFALEKRLENIDKIFEEKNKGIIYRLRNKSPRREIKK